MGKGVNFWDWLSGLSQNFDDPLKEYEKKVISSIQTNARYRAVLLGMQEQLEISLLLLDFCSQHFKFSLGYSDENKAYIAMKLGISVLNVMLECNACENDIASFFTSYQKALDCYPTDIDTELLLAESQQSDPAVQRILQLFERPDLVKTYLSQKLCEEKTFLKLFEIKTQKVLSQNTKMKRLTFFQKMRQHAVDHQMIANRADISLQKAFFNYYFKRRSKKTMQSFDAACKRIFDDQRALRDAKYQALFESIQKGPGALEVCIAQCHSAFSLTKEEINRYLQAFVGQGDQKVYGEPLSEITCDSETLVTWIIKHSPAHQRDQMVCMLYEQGADINLINNIDERRTALHTAVSCDSWPTVSVLMNRGADCCAMDFKARTPLSALIDRLDEYFSIKRNNKFLQTDAQFLDNIYSVLTILISKKAINRSDKILQHHPNKRKSYIAIEGATPFLKFMIYSFSLFTWADGRATPCFIEDTDLYNKTRSFNDFFELFFHYSPAFNKVDISHNTLLHYLAKQNQYYSGEVIDTKVAIDWMLFLEKYPIPFNATNHLGESPAYIACANGRSSLGRVIRDAYNKKCKSNVTGKQPMQVFNALHR